MFTILYISQCDTYGECDEPVSYGTSNTCRIRRMENTANMCIVLNILTLLVVTQQIGHLCDLVSFLVTLCLPTLFPPTLLSCQPVQYVSDKRGCELFCL